MLALALGVIQDGLTLRLVGILGPFVVVTPRQDDPEYAVRFLRIDRYGRPRVTRGTNAAARVGSPQPETVTSCRNG